MQLCCLRHVSLSVTHRAAGSGRPHSGPIVSRHEVSTVQLCCLRPVSLSVTHQAADQGSVRPQVSRLPVPRVWPALPLSPIRPCSVFVQLCLRKTYLLSSVEGHMQSVTEAKWKGLGAGLRREPTDLKLQRHDGVTIICFAC